MHPVFRHSLYSISKVTKIEAVQRRFTKRFLCCCGLQYSERLAKLGVDSLELRRLHFDLIYVYKILFGMIETDASALSAVVNNSDTVTCGHNIFVQQFRTEVRKYFFSNRVTGLDSVGIAYEPRQATSHLWDVCKKVTEN